MEAPVVEQSPRAEIQLIGDDGDYLPARGFGTSTVATIFVGHLGDVELSAFSIASSVIGIFAFGFMLGMGSALDTLCGQAFGAGQVQMLSIYTQRSMIILLATCVLLLPLYIFATPILKLLKQQDDIADLAGHYTRLLIPQLFSLAINFPTRKFCKPRAKSLWLHLSHFFLWLHKSFGVGFSSMFLIGARLDMWKGFSSSAFRGIWPFLRLSLASAVMICLEMWYMTSIVIITGNLNNAVTAVGALSICMNIDGWEAMVFIGINAAIRASRAAKYSVYVTLVQSLLIGILCMIIVLATRNQLAKIFTHSKEMQRAVAHLSSFLGITMLLNSIQPVISGYLLGHVANLGVEGIWGGMIAGVALQTLLLLLLLYKTNWNKEVEQTTERMEKWAGQDTTTERSSTGLSHIENGGQP
ncbi:protein DETOXIFICATION 35 [Sesamum angolense]|uniref:Protein DETOXIFICATION 35 n=1 Tax=Sesamum angolense TaxID=2727404 RepID=A0AAE1X1C4_9LAMI|nr:protein DETOXIFICATION 35 [Sesamum angolense]